MFSGEVVSPSLIIRVVGLHFPILLKLGLAMTCFGQWNVSIGVMWLSDELEALKAREPLPCSLPAVSVDMQACTKMTDLGSRPWWISPIPHLPPSHNGPAAWERNNLWSATEMRAYLLLQQSLAYPDWYSPTRQVPGTVKVYDKEMGWVEKVRRMSLKLWQLSRNLRNIGEGS